MTQTYTVTVDGPLSEKDSEKIRLALQKALAPWFKKGFDVKVEA